jgi:tetratricopeptide (TPR) repeat protein
LVDKYNQIAANYYQLDDIQEALHCLQEAERFMDNKKSTYYCYNLYFKGLSAHKLNEYQKADSILKNCLQCYENNSKLKSIANTNKVLAQTNITLAKYNDARKYANNGLAITEEIHGKNSYEYANFLKDIAAINKITGNYSTAYQQYRQVIEVYTQFNDNSFELAIILSDFAHLEIIFSNSESAKRYSDKAMSITISNGISLTSPSTTHFLNNTAYIEYCFGLYKQADSLYKRIISINNDYNMSFNPTSAEALNGLGLIETAKKNYKQADSLFAEAIIVYTKNLPHNHPLIANVYLNWGILQIKENKLAEAEQKINESFQMNKQFFKPDHDVFADIFTAQGDIAKKRGQNDIARNKYQQALAIYKKHFSDTHWKITETEGKIKR